MTKRTGKNHWTEFKAKAALEVIRSNRQFLNWRIVFKRIGIK